MIRYHRIKIQFNKFLSRQSGELVQAHFIIFIALSIVGIDFGNILKEYSISVHLLKLRAILDLILLFPRLEWWIKIFLGLRKEDP